MSMYAAVSWRKAHRHSGLSAAGTGVLRRSSQILLMLLMYLGRVGPLTLATALIRREKDGARNRVRFPEEKIMIG